MPTSFQKSYATLALDARPDRLDLRDRMYAPKLASLPSAFPAPADVPRIIARYVKAGMILDQENAGACTGFGLAALVNFLGWRANGAPARGVPLASTRMLYHLAQYYDEWPGEDYSGSSCRGALKGWHRHGVCRESLWPYRDGKGRVVFVAPKRGWEHDALTRPLGVYYRIDRQSVVDMQSAIVEIGAIYGSAQAHDGWDRIPVRGAKAVPAIPPAKGERRAGHAFALVGYDQRGFLVQNSWGAGWGRSGFAVLPYEDWLENGTDAWAVALGVPRGDAIPRLAFAPRPLSLPSSPQPRSVTLDSVANRAGDGRGSHDWAYHRTIVMENEGRPVNTLVASPDPAHAVAQVVVEEAIAYFDAQAKSRVRKVMVWAHGGLNDEAASIERIRTIGPQVERYGVYPLFLTWKTGFRETLCAQLEDERKAIPEDRLQPPSGAGCGLLARFKQWIEDAVDRILEVAARNVVIRVLWNQMKQNARAASMAGGGSLLMAERLVDLSKRLADRGETLEVHFIGHSAGAIVAGHVLDALQSRGLEARTLTLYAPACTVGFANQFIAPFFGGNRRGDLKVWTLADDLEQDDTVGPYHRSLLYLVSRALEDFHKTPLLGLARAWEPLRPSDTTWNAEDPYRQQVADDLATWQAFAGGPPDLVTTKQVSNGVESIDAAHGSFDNNVAVVADTLSRISGQAVRPEDLRLDYGGA